MASRVPSGSASGAGAALMLLGLLLALPGCAFASREAARGERIFNGREALPARLDGHDTPLPSQLGKCVACHGGGRQTRLEAGLAPPLTANVLTRAIARRGGKPYAYDRESFCTTLRTGIDPQYVMMLRTMPRFEVSNEQCAALWSYLTEKKHDSQR